MNTLLFRAGRRWALLLALATLVACGETSAVSTPAVPSTVATVAAAPSAAECLDAPGPLPDAFVVGINDPLRFVKGDLVALSADGQTTLQLTNVADGFAAQAPAWSPDGQTLAYTRTRPAPDPTFSWLQQGVICGFDRRTGKGRTLALVPTALTGMDDVAWAPDGTALFVTLLQPQLNDSGQLLGNRASVGRYDLATFTLTTLAEDASSPTVAPDGKRLAFLRYDLSNYTQRLVTTALDGSAEQSLTKPADNFINLFAPRWRPDGSAVAFTGVRAGSASREWWERLLGVGVAQAHGNPGGIWLVNADGANLRVLTSLSLDDPRAAWSRTGDRLAYSAGPDVGVFVLDPALGEQAAASGQQISTTGNYGGITWAK